MNPYAPQDPTQPGQVQPWQQPAYPQQWQPYQQIRPKSPIGHAAVSFLVPGLGCMLAGEVTWGVIILVLWLISIQLTVVTIGFVTGFLCWASGMVAGYMSAQRWNRAHGIIS